MSYSKLISVLILSLLLCGCVVKSRQLNAFITLLNAPAIDVSENAWIARYGGHESTVFAVSTSEGTLFSNRDGDQIMFDGWVIRSLSGLGLSSLRTIFVDNNGERYFKNRGRILSRHQCNPWKRLEKNGVIRFFQNCSDSELYQNTILVDEAGSISLIRQIVDERYTPLTLIKLK